MIVHSPDRSRWAFEPETVHISGVSEVKLTASPELAVATRFTVSPARCALIGWKSMVCAFRPTVKLRVTGVAAAYWPLPACEAMIPQVPAATIVAVVPDTVHTAGRVLAKLTGSPEFAVATKLIVAPTSCDGIAGKLIVCDAALTVKPCVTGVAAAYCVLPG